MSPARVYLIGVWFSLGCATVVSGVYALTALITNAEHVGAWIRSALAL